MRAVDRRAFLARLLAAPLAVVLAPKVIEAAIDHEAELRAYREAYFWSVTPDVPAFSEMRIDWPIGQALWTDRTLARLDTTTL